MARAPAKLNLYLEILGRRADGFHELETLMVPIQLSDSVSFTGSPPSDEGRPSPIDFNVHAWYPARGSTQEPRVPTGCDNLVVRALDLLRERSGCRMGARITLVKRIPAAAGLGGGSSDAAAVLRLANSAWQLNWPTERLVELAAEVGSDVPFFLHGGPALCLGRGEKIERIHPMRRLYFVVVKPPANLSTADVYRAHDSLDAATERRPSQPIRFTVAWERHEFLDAARHMYNRLQSAAASVTPWIARLQAAFSKLDFVVHQLSGSGPAYFGLCRHAQHARRLATILRMQQLGLVYATQSCG
jgi:4-diphosphocytidyl-2-C-methyl-D-erythritol kinase